MAPPIVLWLQGFAQFDASDIGSSLVGQIMDGILSFFGFSSMIGLRIDFGFGSKFGTESWGFYNVQCHWCFVLASSSVELPSLGSYMFSLSYG